MSTTQIPPRDPVSTPPPPATRPEGSEFYEARNWESAYRQFDADSVPHLLVTLQDDLARSRRREAIWLSIIVHLALVILIVNEPRLVRLLPRRAVVLVSPNDMTREKELTYLELPPDVEKLTKRPNTNIISDKDRIATSKSPQLDPKELRKILDASRAGSPGPGGAPEPPQPNQAPAMAQNGQQQPQQEPAPRQDQPPAQNQMAQLQAPPVVKKPTVNFATSMSAGSAVEQAARAALQNRGAGYGGESGDYGLGQGQSGAKTLGQMEVLSDTMGVDFGPYLERVLHDVKQNWYLLIPEVARPPIMKKGKVAIEFAILKNGSIAGMQRNATSGDISLDRAAWGGITNSNPFPPLPSQFGGQYLALRFYFFYNPDQNDLK
jgi:outer membrane biosynthesis protein TonB